LEAEEGRHGLGLMGRNIFLLPVTYFSTKLVYPFTLLVTGVPLKNDIN